MKWQLEKMCRIFTKMYTKKYVIRVIVHVLCSHCELQSWSSLLSLRHLLICWMEAWRSSSYPKL